MKMNRRAMFGGSAALAVTTAAGSSASVVGDEEVKLFIGKRSCRCNCKLYIKSHTTEECFWCGEARGKPDGLSPSL